MNFKLSALCACLVCLILAPTLHAQDDIAVKTDNVIRLYSPNLPADVNVAGWVKTGDFGLLAPIDNTKKATPGPAPAPYPVAMIREKGIEQLGISGTVCDGICFVNGPLWVPGKHALILWTIRIPKPGKRLQSEFMRDLTLQLWVDWNENKAWEQRERMIVQNVNIQNLLSTPAPFIEIQYLTSFVIPRLSLFTGGSGATKYEAKLWVRGALTYDDNDAAPMGDFLFGECEDYLVNYQEIQSSTKIDSKG
ncbi:MAG: GEVED domain-containing protein [Candidatus Krumholzibacteriia bacterium]